jgi:hypothetical protein
MSQLTVPRASGHRLPYDDPASLQEMFGDCVAAGQNLSIRPRPVTRQRPAPPTLEVPVETALMASALHLHLD